MDQKSARFKTGHKALGWRLALSLELWLSPHCSRCEALTALTSGWLSKTAKLRTVKLRDWRTLQSLKPHKETLRTSSWTRHSHVTKKSNHSPEGFPRNASSNDRINSQSAAPGFPTRKGKRNRRSSVNSTWMHVNKQHLYMYFAGNWANWSFNSKDSWESLFVIFLRLNFSRLANNSQ